MLNLGTDHNGLVARRLDRGAQESCLVSLTRWVVLVVEVEVEVEVEMEP
jgi:hypothetical protein